MASRGVPARLHAAGSASAVEDSRALTWRQVGDPVDAPGGGWDVASTGCGPQATNRATGHQATGHQPTGNRAAGQPTPQEELERALAESNRRAQAAAAQSFEDGFQQGRVEGGQMARAELTALVERLARTIADLSGTRDAFRREAEADVVRLSLGVARRVLHRELSVDPDALLGVIRVALGKFEARELHRILVSPQDHAALAAALTSLKLPRQVEVISDPSLERGAALFETVKGTLDASGKVIPIGLFETEEDLQTGHATLSAMSPPGDGFGERTSVDLMEVLAHMSE